MNIYESAENYLEAILSLHERHGLVRSIDMNIISSNFV